MSAVLLSLRPAATAARLAPRWSAQPVRAFHAARPLRANAAGSATVTGDAVVYKHRHAPQWYLECALSACALALVPAAIFVPSAPVDYAMGVIFPIHAYFGLESFITDYMPKHKKPMTHRVALLSARASILLMAYGLYQLNANDIGITNTIKKLWSLH